MTNVTFVLFELGDLGAVDVEARRSKPRVPENIAKRQSDITQPDHAHIKRALRELALEFLVRRVRQSAR